MGHIGFWWGAGAWRLRLTKLLGNALQQSEGVDRKSMVQITSYRELPTGELPTGELPSAADVDCVSYCFVTATAFGPMGPRNWTDTAFQIFDSHI